MLSKLTNAPGKTQLCSSCLNVIASIGEEVMALLVHLQSRSTSSRVCIKGYTTVKEVSDWNIGITSGVLSCCTSQTRYEETHVIYQVVSQADTVQTEQLAKVAKNIIVSQRI